ncbi:MAG: hypothetical protein RIC55_07380 [Pirellulaceae bacterium]
MKAYVFAPLALACLLAVGCQNAQMRSYVDLLNTEQRLVEDDYYALLSEYRYLGDQAQQLESENVTLRKRLGLTPTDPIATTPAETAPGPGFSSPGGLETPEIDLGTPDINLGTPDIEIPDAPKSLPNSRRLPAETVPGGAASIESRRVGTGDAEVESVSRNDEQFEQVAEQEYVPPDDLRVTHVVINPVLTSGHNFDRRAGDDGVSIVFEPRNAADAFVPRGGDVSIVLLDPAEEGQLQRVARWDFPLEEVVHRIRTEKFGRGVNFKLRWSDRPPAHKNLYVFVRYTSDDGRVMEDNREIEIAFAGDVSNRWTPKSAEAEAADEADAGLPVEDVSQQIRVGLPASSASSKRAAEQMPAPPRRTAAPTSPPEDLGAPPMPAWSPDRPSS